MVRIGLTGGIGCGKSYVARLLEKRGVPVYDSDTEAKRLSDTSIAIREQLTELTGIEDLYSNGILDRKKLAAFLFASADNARKVESVIHPVVKADYNSWADTLNVSLSVIESAILIESGFAELVDFVVVVDAPDELRISRCIKRDSTTREKVLDRMAAQMSQQEKCLQADFVIFNDDISDLDKQIDEMLCFIEENVKNNL